MDSPKSSTDEVAMPPTYNAANSTDGGTRDDKPAQFTAFCYFQKLPKEIQDMVWEESKGDNNIYFFKIHISHDTQGRETTARLGLDKESTAAHWASMELTCKRAKEAVDRAHRVAVSDGEQFQYMTINTHLGETHVRVNVKDIMCFGFVNDEVPSLASQALPTNSPVIAHPAPLPGPRTVSLPAQWSWLRRFAMHFDVKFCPNEAPSLAAGAHEHNFPVCYYCIAWNLSGLASLEEVDFIVGGLPKPTIENPYGLLTKLSSNLDEGPINCWILADRLCDDFSPENKEEKRDDGEFETDASLKVINGSDREYYQVRLSYIGRNGEVHHSLRHFDHEFISCEKERDSVYNRAPRDHPVHFKVFSYED